MKTLLQPYFESSQFTKNNICSKMTKHILISFTLKLSCIFKSLITQTLKKQLPGKESNVSSLQVSLSSSLKIFQTTSDRGSCKYLQLIGHYMEFKP